MIGDPAEIPIPEALRTQYRVSFIRFQSPTAALFEGVDPEHGSTVLVKVMRPDPTASPADRQRVRRELQKLVQLRHPALVPILDLGEEDGLHWIIRPFVVGETLSERIASRGRLSPVEAATLGLHLAAGLGELHRHGLLHRDLRPGHVLLGQDGGVYLIDAGLGRTLVSPNGRALVGCPGYAAPEAILGRLMSFRSDLYGLGAVLYEGLSGMPPYMALDPQRMMQLQCEADPEPLDASLPPELTRLVSTLLARDPRERPMSAQIVERQLEPMVFSISPAGPEEENEPGERTLMTDSAEGFVSPAGLVYEAPAPQITAAPPVFRVPTPAPAALIRGPVSAPAPVFKQTMMGTSPNLPAGRPGQSARESHRSTPDALPREALDFEDVVDTHLNEVSRVFGIPSNARVAGGSAIIPLAPETDPESAPHMAPPTYQQTPVGAAPMASGGFPQQGQHSPPSPQFESPASHTVAMDARPAAFLNYGQPGQPMQGQPMQGQPHWSPYGPGPGGPGLSPMSAPIAAPPKSSALGLLVGLIGLVAVAGGGGYLAARARRAHNPTTPALSVTPESPLVQLPMPVEPSASSDAETLLVATDVPSSAQPDLPPVVVASPEVVPAIPLPIPVPVRADAGTVAPSPRPAPVARVHPVAHVTPPRPVVSSPRPVVSSPRPAPVARGNSVAHVTPPRPVAAARPTATGDAGVAVTPLTDAIRRQDWTAARRLLADQLRAHPNDAAAHAQLGYVLDRLGDSSGALAEYRSATRLDRRNTRYFHRLADLQVATGDRAGAIATLQQILRINPAEPAARARLDQLQGAH